MIYRSHYLKRLVNFCTYNEKMIFGWVSSCFNLKPTYFKKEGQFNLSRYMPLSYLFSAFRNLGKCLQITLLSDLPKLQILIDSQKGFLNKFALVKL